MMGAAWPIDHDVAIRAFEVEERIQSLKLTDSAEKFEALVRNLLRSEAISSSRLEGLNSNIKAHHHSRTLHA